MAINVLIVDDDPVQRRLLEAMVRRFGYEAIVAEGGDAAMRAPADAHIDCVVLDLVMPDLDGLGVLARMREAGLSTPVIVQTAHGGIDNVVSAMRAGAVDFVVKPVGAERLQVSLRNALAASALETEFQRLKRSRAGTLTFKDIITRSPRMHAVLRSAEKAAGSTIPVLIEGESGVGKELIARAIHGCGERRAKPFVAVNCGAIPDNLVESILFGHEKGAFTGATERHTGKFVEASGRHAVPRRGRRTAAGRAGQAAARDPGGRGRAGRRAQAGQGRRADHLRHQPQPDRRRAEGPLPRGPVLPPARVPDLGAAARRAARGHPGPGAPFPRALLGRGGQAHPRGLGRGASACSAPIPGRAMSASSRTRCSAPWCWPKATRSASPEFPQIAAQVPSLPIAGLADAPPALLLDEPAMRCRQRHAVDRRGCAAARPRSTPPPAAPIEHVRTRVVSPFWTLPGEVRPLDEIETEAIRFAITHYRGQMSEVARRLRIGRSTLYRKLKDLGFDEDGTTGEPENVAGG